MADPGPPGVLPHVRQMHPGAAPSPHVGRIDHAPFVEKVDAGYGRCGRGG